MDRLMLKQRVVGALVLLSLAVIFLPLLFDQEPAAFEEQKEWLPPPPEVEEFGSYEPKQVEYPDPAAQDLWTAQDTPEENPEVMPPAPVADEDLPDRPVLDAESIPQAWSVQLATFAQRSNADKLSERLQQAGYQAYVRDINTQKGPMVRVFVGPELVATEARKLRDKLKSEFKLTGIVVQFKP